MRWEGDERGVGVADGGTLAPGVEIRQAVFALLGSIAESAAFVRQRRVEGEPLQFEIATGMLGDAAFAPHGHTLRLFISS